MKILKNIQIDGTCGKPILLDIFYKADGTAKPVVIFSHGFKGFKDWGHFNLVAEQFAQEGFVFVKFNFSHNGTTPENPSEFSDLEAFGNNNFSIELEDLGRVIDFVVDAQELDKDADKANIYLLAHSRGGAISILKGFEDERVKKVATWASINQFGRYWSPETMEEWKRTGVNYVINGRTGQKMPLYYQIYEDFYAHKDKLDVPKAVRNMDKPFLIVHGTNDDAVDYESALQMKEWNSAIKLLTIPGGNHVFGAKHPWSESTLPDDAAFVVRETIRFFQI